MAETKFLYLILTLVGVPAFIYSWFINLGNITNTIDLVKNIGIMVIGFGWSTVQLIRLYIKMRNEHHNRDYKKPRPKREMLP